MALNTHPRPPSYKTLALHIYTIYMNFTSHIKSHKYCSTSPSSFSIHQGKNVHNKQRPVMLHITRASSLEN